MSQASPLLRWLAHTACWLFYRVDQAGTAPPAGPVLFLANHANALLDPAIIWTTAGRDVRFLAKSTLFDGLFRPFLAGAGAIPVYRRKDEGVDPSRNAEMFAAVDAALREGDAVCIFPEGVSHSQGRLIALRTGAARIVLAAEASGTRVALVAVGLNFDRKTRFRSRVTAAYGPAFYASDLQARTPDEQRDAVRTLTDRIAVHMRQLLVEADPGADARLVDRVDRLYSAARGRPRQAEERIARRQAIATGIERMRSNDPARYEELLFRIRRYDARLRRFRLRDRHLDMDVTANAAAGFAAREALLAIPLVPVALAGLVLFFVPYWLTAIAARLATREPDVAASAKVIAGSIIYALWIVGAIALAWLWKGPVAAAITGIALPLTAVASLFAVERESAVIDAIRAWIAIRRARFGAGLLRQRRSELADVLDEAYAWVTSQASDPMASARS
ncbi:MAG: 1-acyl-sn-glycerol-3-phosphate acyltransferase [Vicinamibacterales bacterium]